MILSLKKNTSSWDRNKNHEPENFWASYSDLMAGLLMIFALTTVVTILEIGHRLIEPTEILEKWQKVINEIRNDKELATISNIHIDADTGALIISDKNLRFGFGDSDLGEEAEQILKKAVPKYLEIISRYPDFLELINVIEIAGHTDRKDHNNANPYLSRRRAGQVHHFLSNEPEMRPHLKLFNNKAITAGYAATRFPKTCLEDTCAEARRVEITILLKERDVLKEFQRILKEIIR